MSKKLPSRPDLDHLRRQAKALLSALALGDVAAEDIIREHLPAARGWTREVVRGAGLRLADAQSAIARKSGFASWPALARHVEQLRSLEGTWTFVSLEVEGEASPTTSFATSQLLIDGDRFRTETPEAVYEGTFNIDVEAEPHGIDIDFVEGPEAGNQNRGIFRLEGDRLELCLDMNGNARPVAFKTAPGSGQAFEVLRRASGARPEAVTGGTAPAKIAQPQPAPPLAAATGEGFEFVPSQTLMKLQGEWVCVSAMLDGKEMPGAMAGSGRRVAKENEVKVSFGGRTMIHAKVRLNEAAEPMAIDYLLLAGPAVGAMQAGILKFAGDEVMFCMAKPGATRPTDFSCPAGSGHTLSRWRRKKV